MQSTMLPLFYPDTAWAWLTMTERGPLLETLDVPGPGGATGYRVPTTTLRRGALPDRGRPSRVIRGRR